MPETKVAIRLGVDGAAQVRNDFASVGAAGTVAMGEITAATTAAGAASERYTQRQIDGFAKQAAAAKIAAAAQAQQDAFNNVLGIKPVESGTARASAEAFGLLGDAERATAAETEKLNALFGLNRQQTVIAQSAVLRFVDTLVAGQSPLRAFALEAHKIPEVMSVDDGGMAGGLAKVTRLFSPFNIAIAAGSILAIGGAVAVYEYSAAIDKLNGVAKGSGALIGASGEALEMAAEKAAAAGHITVGAAREIETAYVNMGKIGLTILPGLTAATTDFAVATGTDVKTATETLGKAFQDPVKGASDLTERYGYLTQAQLTAIKAFVDANDALGAQKVLLDAVSTATAHAAENVGFLGRLWSNFKADVSGKLESVVKSIDDAFDGLPKVEKLLSLQKELDGARANYSGGLGQAGHIAALEKEIAAQQKLVDADILRTQSAKDAAVANSEAETARKAAAAFSGEDTLDALKAKRAAINATVERGVGVTRELLDAQSAYNHAIETFIPAAEKHQRIAALDAQIAAATTPARKAELAAAKERIDQSGRLVTSAQAEADAHAKGAAAAATAAKAGDGHAATLARQAAAMDVAATSALALADAWLAGGVAGIEAEARRKAATDATKKGIDVEAQVRRQLALDVADGAAAGAKAVGALREESAARSVINDLVATGAINTDAANGRLKDEAALRPLLRLQTIAHGDALAVLTRVIDGYRAALASAHDEEDRSAVAKIVEDAKRTIAGLQDTAALAGDQTGVAAVEIARRAALRNAAAKNYTAGQGDELAASAAAVETNRLIADRVKYLADGANAQRDARQLSLAELATIGMDVDRRAVLLDTLREELALRARGIDLGSTEARSRLAGIADEDRIKAAIRAQTAAMGELATVGTQLVDDVLNPNNWSSWGSLGKSVLRDIEAEFIKLAAINPLKNLLGLGGGGLPTLGSVGGLLGGLFGGGDPIAGGIGSLIASNSAISIPFNIPHNASGSESFAGGLTWMNENGAELVDLPRGSRITNAADTRRMLAGNDNGRGDVHQHFYLDGAVVDQSLYAKMLAVGVNAAAGGAAMAKDERYRDARRALR